MLSLYFNESKCENNSELLRLRSNSYSKLAINRILPSIGYSSKCLKEKKTTYVDSNLQKYICIKTAQYFSHSDKYLNEGLTLFVWYTQGGKRKKKKILEEIAIIKFLEKIKYLSDWENAQINWDENTMFITQWPSSVPVMGLEIPSRLLF